MTSTIRRICSIQKTSFFSHPFIFCVNNQENYEQLTILNKIHHTRMPLNKAPSYIFPFVAMVSVPNKMNHYAVLPVFGIIPKIFYIDIVLFGSPLHKLHYMLTSAYLSKIWDKNVKEIPMKCKFSSYYVTIYNIHFFHSFGKKPENQNNIFTALKSVHRFSEFQYHHWYK